MQEQNIQKMKSQMHGKDIIAVGGNLISNVQAVVTGSGNGDTKKDRETLDTVFKMPTFYYHHGKKLR